VTAFCLIGAGLNAAFECGVLTYER
jgi:hypothetical protein